MGKELLSDKYSRIRTAFYQNFVYDGYSEERAANIPLSSVRNGIGSVGDGTINIAYYLQFLFTEMILGNKDYDDVNKVLKTLSRLSDAAYKLVADANPGVYFNREPGFFLRDDIHSEDASKFGLARIYSGYTGSIELIDEDPCYSPFVSQDQIWNLAPILAYLSNHGFEEATNFGFHIFEYVVRNKHVIYNPYYSALLHHWTYLPEINGNKLKPWDRIPDRNAHLKYKVKVKRGAHNWYFAGGFKWAFKKFEGDCHTFWANLWYKPFIFLADRIYHPYICKWFKLKVKNNSYYCLGSTNKRSWYGPGFSKRLIKKFNKSLKNGDKELFMPHLVFLSDKLNEIDMDSLLTWLDNYEWNGVDTPIEFLILYNWYHIFKKGEANEGIL